MESMSEWVSRSPEDQLLEKYWKCPLEGNGRIYVEVPIAGPGGYELWRTASTCRRIDGVWIKESKYSSSIVKYSEFRHDLKKDLEKGYAELI